MSSLTSARGALTTLPGKIKNPEEVSANLFREDYNRYLDTYQPLEDYLFNSLDGWGDITNSAQNSALTRSNRQFEKAEEAQNRNFASYGIDPSPEQKASLRRQYDIAAATSAVNAANSTGRQMEDLKYGLIGGYSPYRAGA